MDEHIGAAGEPVQGRAVGEASGYYVHILIGEEARPRRIARQHSNVVSPRDERGRDVAAHEPRDRKSTRLNSSHDQISYAVFCLKKKKNVRPKRREPHRNFSTRYSRS